jgi:hypothetical protein
MRVLAMLQLKSSDKIAQAQYLISVVHNKDKEQRHFTLFDVVSIFFDLDRLTPPT